FSPKEVYLPRSSDEGPIYHAMCMFHSPLGREFALKIDHVPPGLKINFDETRRTACSQFLRVEWERSSQGQASGRRVIRLIGDVGGAPCPLEVAVNCSAEDAP